MSMKKTKKKKIVIREPDYTKIENRELIEQAFRLKSSPEVLKKLEANYKDLALIDNVTVAELVGYGLSEQRSQEIKAIIELMKRFIQASQKEGFRIKGANSFINYALDKYLVEREYRTVAFYLDEEKQIIEEREVDLSSDRVVSGILNHAVRNGSDGILIATIQGNNDRIVPTDTELYVAQEVGKACTLFRLKLLDWLIIGKRKYFSFRGEQRI